LIAEHAYNTSAEEYGDKFIKALPTAWANVISHAGGNHFKD